MGQYFVIANLDKKEYIHPDRFEGTLDLSTMSKLKSICGGWIAGVIPFLLRQSATLADNGYPVNNTMCGGDIQKDYSHAGLWAGDRIVVVGDYDEVMPQVYKAIKDGDPDWVDISHEAANDYIDFMGEDHFIGAMDKIAAFLEEG